MQEKQIKIHKLELNYKFLSDENNSFTFLILHGRGGSSDSWVQVWEKLFENWFNIIIPDLPWFWKTDITSALTLDDYSKIIEDFAEKLKLKDIILTWHSNGWAISIKLENRWYLKPLRLILNNSAGIRNDKKRSFKRKAFNSFVKIIKKSIKFLPPLRGKARMGVLKLRILFYKAIWSHDYIKAEDNKYLKETYQNMISSDLKEEIKAIKLNTLLIWGEIDTYTPISDAYFMRENIENSKLQILDNEKHGIHLQNPDRLVKTILDNI